MILKCDRCGRIVRIIGTLVVTYSLSETRCFMITQDSVCSCGEEAMEEEERENENDF